MSIIPMKIGDDDYVAIPKSEHDRLTTEKLTRKQKKTLYQHSIESASLSWTPKHIN
ncbi:hypothetical protein [uncultured Winogradskyella sp.]|uniref:hypothetical protein n=1 Tax=uncultured Winogradskyella sp. TaxID=395353 RepID=UPI00262A81A2|nr:hypothetical protein [uncultured Winogradskyella sp.]